MNARRPSIPKSLRDRVLEEYNHRCAICGADRPHLHHIDENPSNNIDLNLLPLCPNHHLNDQHNPTTKLPVPRLALFRKFKDPQILAPQFAPLFSRVWFLLNPPTALSYAELNGAVVDLIDFVSHMEMGGYYAKQLHQIIGPANGYSYTSGPGEPERTLGALQSAALERHATRCVELIVEQLRYQRWPVYGG